MHNHSGFRYGLCHSGRFFCVVDSRLYRFGGSFRFDRRRSILCRIGGIFSKLRQQFRGHLQHSRRFIAVVIVVTGRLRGRGRFR